MRNLEKYLWSFLLIATLLVSQSCDEEEDEEYTGDWFASVDYEGQRRAGAITFTIGNNAFVGLGYDGSDYFKDFYSYNADNGYWEDVAAFPGTPRESAVAFAIGDKGYVGLGYNRDEDKEELADFWEYNSVTNEWKQLNNFPSARYGAVAFAINGYGYVGTGNDGDYYLSDFYRYLPDGDTWEEIRSFPGGKREDALAVVHNGLAYITTGRNNGSYKYDFWSFNPEGTTWTDLSLDSDDDDDQYSLFKAAVARHQAVGFAYQDRIFISTGTSSSTVTTSTYQFDPGTGLWDDRTVLEGSARTRAVAFVVNNRMFVGLGQNGSSYWDNVLEFKPDDDYDEDN